MVLETINWDSIVSAVSGFVALVTTVIAGIQTVLKKIAVDKTAAAETETQSAIAEADAAEERAQQAEEDLKNYDALMDPYAVQTDAQTALITSGKVSDDTWKMNLDTKEELYQKLIAAGAVVSRDAVNAGVKYAEEHCMVEYALRCFYNEKGKSEDDSPSAFISYGVIDTVAGWQTVKPIATAHKCADWISVNG